MPLKTVYNAVVFFLVSLLPFFPKTQPESIGHLVGLKDLWLDGNQLTEIPAVSQFCSLSPLPPFFFESFEYNSTKSGFIIFPIKILKRWCHVTFAAFWTLGDGQYEKSVVSGCIRKQNRKTSRGTGRSAVSCRLTGFSKPHWCSTRKHR